MGVSGSFSTSTEPLGPAPKRPDLSMRMTLASPSLPPASDAQHRRNHKLCCRADARCRDLCARSMATGTMRASGAALVSSTNGATDTKSLPQMQQFFNEAFRQ